MRYLNIATVMLLLSACAGPPDIMSGLNPSDPAAPAKPIIHVPVNDDAARYAPVTPMPWKEKNTQVEPSAEGHHEHGQY